MVIAEIFTFSLAVILCVCLFRTMVAIDFIFSTWIEAMSVLTGYFLLLLYSHNATPLHELKAYYLFHRIGFSILYCALLFMYEVAFTRMQPLDIAYFMDTVFSIFLVFMVTYVPYRLYKLALTKKVTHGIN